MSDSQMGDSEYERTVNVETGRFVVSTTIEIKDTASHPELLADRLQDHLDECLLEFVVSEQNNQG